MVTTDVTVVVPTIPPRGPDGSRLLERALASVAAQTAAPAGGVEVALDDVHAGAAATRNRALANVRTGWFAPLDDDDEFLPHHLATLLAAAEESGADVVYPGCVIVDADGAEFNMGLHDDYAGRCGQPFDPELLRQRSYIPVTALVRTDLAQRVGGYQCPPGSPYDDWGFYLALLDAGARFVHVPVRTWRWWHHGYGQPGVPGNTSGQPDRW